MHPQGSCRNKVSKGLNASYWPRGMSSTSPRDSLFVCDRVGTIVGGRAPRPSKPSKTEAYLVIALNLSIDGHDAATARFRFLNRLAPRVGYDFCGGDLRKATASPIRGGAVFPVPLRKVAVVLV